MQTVHELSLRFTSEETTEDSPINLLLFRSDTGTMTPPSPFTPPLAEPQLTDLRWYLEVFPAWPTGPDYQRSTEIEAQLENWGRILLKSVISAGDAARLWQQFVDAEAETKLLTIDATDPRVLRLPWELLADEGGHIFAQGISVRRRLQKSTSTPIKSLALPVRILVVVARPNDAGFIDPRAVSLPLLDALSELGMRVEVEFLVTPTLQSLTNRLRDRNAAPIHVVHFDGHGVYDPSLGLGFLIFENDQYQSDYVDANRLGTLVNRSGVPLMVLNACQSSSQQGTNPYASIAARLIRAGVGSVLAMNYSVLVVAAHKFVEGFYGALADGLTVGQAVDEGRFALLADEQRHTITRHNIKGEIIEDTIRLRDWFLPALYQQAVDPIVFSPDLSPSDHSSAPPALPLALVDSSVPGGLPAKPLHNFHGRAREILRLGRSLTTHAIVVVHGFGGLGKTSLAAEAGRWFYRTKQFPGGAAFVSFEHGGSLTQLCSWVGQAISGDPNFMLGDGDPVTRVANLLQERPALIILDNFESVLGRHPLMPLDELKAVLDAVWTWVVGVRPAAGRRSRVLITTRDTTFNDARFSPSKECAHIELQGLTRSDAMALAAAILDDHGIDRTTVDRQGLMALVDSLGGHPLSLNLVLPHLRHHTPSELSSRFEELLPGFTLGAAKERNESLAVSLEFSLRRLSETTRLALLDLAVFEGGAMEYDILAIIQIEEDAWKAVRSELEQAALMTAESLPGFASPYIQFHPTLIPYLATQLTDERRSELEARYRKEYRDSANMLWYNFSQYPQATLAITLRELPNLQRALQLIIDANELETAIDFADVIINLLDRTDRWREKEQLLSKMKAIASKVSSKEQYEVTRHQIESLRRQGRQLEAIKLINQLLPGTTGQEKALLMADLGRCFLNMKQYKQAIASYKQALQLYEDVEMRVSEMSGTCHAELADTFVAMGQYQEAQTEYELAQDIFQELNSLEGLAFVAGNLGILAYQRNDFSEAIKRHQQAQQLYHVLNMPREEAVDLHQLGLIFSELNRLDEAEKSYRQALQIMERMNDIPRMKIIYSNLGILAEQAGRLNDAERWYLQSIQLAKQLDPHHELETCNNLALLYLEMNRLQDAEQYARQGADLIEQHDLQDPKAWNLYAILAQVAEAKGDSATAAQWRRKAQQYQAAAGVAQYQLPEWAPQLVAAVVASAQGNRAADEPVANVLSQLDAHEDWQKLAGAIRNILSGKRDLDHLCESLDPIDTQIVQKIVSQLVNPTPESAQTGVIQPAAESQVQNVSAAIAHVRQQWEPVIKGIVAACKGDAEAASSVHQLLDRLSTQNDWRDLAAVLRRIVTGERDSKALLIGLDPTDTVIVSDVLHLLGEEVDSIPASGTETDEEGVTLENFFKMIALACQPNAPEGLAEQLRAVTDDIATDPNQPEEIHALGRVLNTILDGERNPDLTALEPEIAGKVRELLVALS